MLINFCRNSLKTTIDCTCLTHDSGEVENLLSECSRTFYQSHGFMAEYYIKCPVEIIITFPCLVDISAVVLEPKLSAQRTRGFELFTIFQKPVVHREDHHTNGLERLSTADDVSCVYAFPCSYQLDFSSPAVRSKNRYMMNFLGKYSEPRDESYPPDRVVVRNSSHPEQYKQPDHNLTAYIEARQNASLRACSNIVLVLTWATVPVIRKLEVWGTPSQSNPRDALKHIESMVFKPRKSVLRAAPVPDVIDLSEPEEKPSVQKHVKEHPFNISEIPEEFIDPITCNLMAMPMLLPSGNIIDRETLDRYIEAEAAFGRAPSDPFTSLPFNKSRKPVPNASLKGRIDRYVLQNASRIEACARTASEDIAQNNKTLDKVRKSVKKRSEIRSGRSETSTSKRLKLNPATKVSNGASTRSQNPTPILISDVDVDYSKTTNSDLGLPPPPPPPPPPPSKPSFTGESTHENELQNSLDLSLLQTLSTLPVSATSSPNAYVLPAACTLCDSDEKSTLFRLPCHHVFCRICLQNLLLSKKLCSNCGATFGRLDAVKL